MGTKSQTRRTCRCTSHAYPVKGFTPPVMLRMPPSPFHSVHGEGEKQGAKYCAPTKILWPVVGEFTWWMKNGVGGNSRMRRAGTAILRGSSPTQTSAAGGHTGPPLRIISQGQMRRTRRRASLRKSLGMQGGWGGGWNLIGVRVGAVSDLSETGENRCDPDTLSTERF